MPVALSVMVCIGRVMLDTLRDGQSSTRWEPWTCPLLFLRRSNADSLIEGVLRNYPFDLGSGEVLTELGGQFGFVFLSFGVDSAASNLQAMCWFQDQIMNDGPENISLHYEPCASHQVHIVKSRCIDVAGFAGQLYSSSKLLRLSSSLNGMRDAIHSILELKLDLVLQAGPETIENHPFMLVCRHIFGVDGDLSFLYSHKNGQRTPKPFLIDLQELCKHVAYDADQGRWKYMAWTFEEHDTARRQGRPLPSMCREDAVCQASVLLQNVCFGKAWPIAALARWTHVVDGMKRLVFGIALGGILSDAFSLLGTAMRLDEAHVQARLAEVAASVAAGGQDDGWAKHCARVLRVAKFWGQAEHKWKAGIVLIALAPVDRLTYLIMGTGQGPAKLNDMVDPEKSIVGRASQQILRLLSVWSDNEDNTTWTLLGELGFADWEVNSCMRQFARKQCVQLSCGIFRRLVVRLAGFPYRLQWLSSSAVSDEVKETLADEFFALPEHCLSPATRRIRQKIGTSLRLLGPEGLHMVGALEHAISFSTHPVEVQHRSCRDEIQSATRGSGHAHSAHRAVVRQVTQAFVHKGNSNPTMQARRAAQPSGETTPQQPLAVAGAGAPHGDGVHDGALFAMAGPGGAVAVAAGVAYFGLDSLGGGNPRMMYMNHRLQVEKAGRAGAVITGEESRKEQEAILAKYDQSEDLQCRWKLLFQAVMRRRKREDSFATISAPDKAQPVWPRSDVSAPERRLPVPPATIVERYNEKFGSTAALDDGCTNASPFIIGTESAPRRAGVLRGGWGTAWGCKGHYMNVCQHSMQQDRLCAYHDLHVALARFVDKMKTAATSVELWVCFSGEQTGTGKPLNKISLLGDATFKPKSQVWVQCKPKPAEGGAGDNMFFEVLPEFPWKVQMMAGRSRLSPAHGASFDDLQCLTSAELCHQLVSAGSSWTVRHLKVQEALDEQTLLVMQVVGWADGEFDLEAPAVRQPVPKSDAVLAFLRVAGVRQRAGRSGGRGHGRSGGLGAVRPRGGRHQSRSESMPLDDDDDSASAPVPVIENIDFVEEDPLDDAADFDAQLAEIMEQDLADEAAGRQVAGGATLHGEPASDEAEDVSECDENEDALDLMLETAGADVEIEPRSVSSAASSSTSFVVPAPAATTENRVGHADEPVVAPAPVPPQPSATDPVIQVSEKGYVTCTFANGQNKLVGRVTSWGKNMSARCAIHSGCNWASTRVDQGTLVRWLSRGRAPEPGSSGAEYEAARAEHIADRR